MHYAVKEGKKPGIYSTWDECKEQVNGYAGAIYKKFKTEQEAKEFLGYTDTCNLKIPKVKKYEYELTMPLANGERISTSSMDDIDNVQFYVDGSFNDKDKIVGYGLVAVKYDTAVLRDLGTSHPKEDVESRNVLGELKGALKAADLAVANGYKNITILYDYKGVELWATGGWKAKKEITQYYRDIMQERMKTINITFVKIKSHSGNKWNDEADRFARIGALL